MDNTTAYLTAVGLNLTASYPAATDIAHSNSSVTFLARGTAYSSGWTEATEDLLKTPVEVTTFFDTEYDGNITGTLATPESDGVAEGPALSTGQIAIAVASGFFCFVTVVANLLVLYAFCVDRRLHTYMNYYIVGLSFADLVAGVFTMPLYTVYWVLGYWPFSAALCDIYLYTNHVFIHISLLAILILAVDRHQAVYHPLKHLQKRTLRHATFMISISYVIPFFLWLPYTLLWPYIVGVRRIRPGFCYPQYVVDSLLFSILAPVFFFWIPFPITSALYWRIYVVIRKRKTQKKGTVTMEELDSTSASMKTIEAEEATNNSVKAPSQHPEQPAGHATKPTLDNNDAAPELGHDNPAFDNQEENGTLGVNTITDPKDMQFQTTQVPNVSHLHSQQQRPPVAEVNDNSKTGHPDRRAAGQHSQVLRSRTTQRNRESKKESHRATRTLTLIFIVLIFSSLPWSILVIIYCVCPSCMPLVVYQASVYIAHMNSTVNPFCYAIANPLYLQAVQRLLCCGRNTKRRGSRN